jgi:hypothetical protein
MRVLVTGGLGFQGTHLCSSLVEEGHLVTVLNTLSLRARASEESSRASGVVWGSVTDKDLVQKTVREHNLVYHLAANIHVDESRKDPEAYSRVNVLGTEKIQRPILGSTYWGRKTLLELASILKSLLFTFLVARSTEEATRQLLRISLYILEVLMLPLRPELTV